MGLTGAARALSNPIRLRILNHLLFEGERVSANSFSRLHPEVTLANADFHLRTLDRVGVARKLPERLRLTETSRPEWVYDLDGINAGCVRDALDVFQGRKGIAASKGSDPLTLRVDDDELLLLAKLLTDPLRVRVLLALRKRRGGLLSPVEAARMFDKHVGAVSYSFACLRRDGVAEIRDTRPRRGAVEHLHAFGGPRVTVALALLRILAGHVDLVEIQPTRPADGLIFSTDLQGNGAALVA